MGVARGRAFRLARLRGESVTVGDRAVTPIARALTLSIRLPGLPAGLGLAWVRPVALETTYGGTTRTIRIIDWTRLSTLGIGLAAYLALKWVTRRGEVDRGLRKKGADGDTAARGHSAREGL